MDSRTMVATAAAREFLTHDLGPLGALAARVAYVGASGAMAAARTRPRAMRTMLRLHSGAFSPAVDRLIVSRLKHALHHPDSAEGRALAGLFSGLVQDAVRQFTDPQGKTRSRILGARALVVKSPRAREPGVLVIDYSYVFPLMHGLFDLPRIAERYTLVLEPSWAGASNPDILLYTRLQTPVFVQTIEPRDRDFLNALGTNLNVVPVAANWWVDPRLAPQPDGARDIDVIMVAAWADIKRHWRVFRALRDLRRRGHPLKVALVGYQYDRSKADIEALAEYFGVRDQVTTYERISQQEVSALLARSKVHVLWSRRECANRAIVEAMLADVPVIVREGLTFGFRYPYINEQTGRFVRESELADAIIETIAERSRYRPRAWVLANMTCERATSALNAHLKAEALSRGMPWTEDLVVKTSTLDEQRYFHSEDAARFEADYRFLESCRQQAT